MTAGQFNPWTRARKLKVTAAVIAAAGATAGSYYGWGTVVSPGGNDTTAPIVALSAPAADATVSGASTTVSATCSDDIGCVGVQFKLDGANIGAEDTSAPYSISWDTTGANDGSHTLTAVARDAANNTTTSATVSVTISNGTGGSPPVANLFTSPTGSNTGTNCKHFAVAQIAPDPATVCLTLQKAYSLAVGGDVVEVMNGTYASAQTVFPNAAVTSTVTFVPEEAANVIFSNVVQIKASHVTLDGFTFAPFTSQSGHPFNIIIQPPDGGTSSFACISDITLNDLNGGNFSINNGVSDLHITGGTYGQDGWRLGDTPNGTTSWNAPTIAASGSLNCPDSSTVAAPATDITIDGVKFGDRLTACQDNATYGNNPQSTCAEPTHPDCLHVYGPTVRLTVQNSWFDHCMGFYMNLNVENNSAVNGNTTIKDALFQNNIFGDDNHGGTSTTDCNGNTVSSRQVSCDSWGQITQAGTGPLYVQCDNVVFRNNTWGHDQTTNTLWAINCPKATGASVGVAFYNNIFQNWNGACPSNTTWDYNLFVTGSTCGTHTSTGDADFVQATDDAHAAPYAFASIPWTSDFTPGASSAAIGAGNCDATTAATTDYNGDARPTGTCDVGAINH